MVDWVTLSNHPEIMNHIVIYYENLLLRPNLDGLLIILTHKKQNGSKWPFEETKNQETIKKFWANGRAPHTNGFSIV